MAVQSPPTTSPPLAYGFHGAGEGTLRLRNTARNAEQEEVTFAGPTSEIRSVHQIVGTKFSNGYPVGYEIRDGGQILAAVETINHGRVWRAPPPGLGGSDPGRAGCNGVLDV